MNESIYHGRYSENLPKKNDFLVNREALFKRTIKELTLIESDKILEIGCDNGEFVKRLKNNFDVLGIDINKEAILSGNCNNLQVMDITNNSFKTNTFNKIYSFHTIEHIPDLNKFFEEVDRILVPGGVIALIYPFEPIRGVFALRTAFKNRINPRKLHIHKLYPKKIKSYIKQTSLTYKKSYLLFLTIPQFITILEKREIKP